ncbi:MAG TPA: hypothetical protein GXX55_05165 [Firmicutes bacterium]|nr:hypothetical protein [Bacillota bacterium]
MGTKERGGGRREQPEWAGAARLGALLRSLERGERQPAAVRSEIRALHREMGEALAEHLAAYLRDEISVKELGVVAWVAQQLPAEEVRPAFARLARDQKCSHIVRVKAAQVVMTLAGRGGERPSFEEQLAEFGLLSEEVGTILYSLAQESVLGLVEEIGHPVLVEQAIEAALTIQEAVGDDLFNIIPRIAAARAPAAANVLAALAVGGETVEVRAQARRALIRLAREGIEPDSPALQELATPRYAGTFRVSGPPGSQAESWHVVWQFSSGLMQSAGFLLRRRTPRRSARPQPPQLVDGYVSRLFPPPVMAQLIFLPYFPDEVVRVEKLEFTEVQTTLAKAWQERKARPGGLPESLHMFRGFLDNWLFGGELVGATRNETAIDLLAHRDPRPLLEGMAAEVGRLVEDSLQRIGWKSEEICGALALWAAYVYMAKPRLRQAPPWAATVVYASRTLRGESLKQSEVAAAFRVTPATITRNFEDLVRRLNLRGERGLVPIRLPGWRDSS